MLILLNSSFVFSQIKLNKHNTRSNTSKTEFDYKISFLNALKEKSIGNTDAAILGFSTCVKIDSQNPSAMYELALIYYNLNKYTDALFFIKGAYQLDNQNVWYKKLLAKLYSINNQYTKAIPLYKSLINENPYSEENYFDLSNAYLLDGQLKKAIEVYDLKENYFGHEPQLTQQKYKIYLELRDRKGAKKELEKWIKNDINNIEPLNLLAELYLLEGDHDQVIKTLEKALILSPNSGKTNLTLFSLYFNKGLIKQSINALKKSFETRDLGIESKIRVLIKYFFIPNPDTLLYDELKNYLFILKKSHPSDPRPLNLLGQYFQQEENLEEAKYYFNKSSKIDQSQFSVWQQLIIISFDLKEYNYVISLSDTISELFPSQPIPYLLKGMSFIQTDQSQKAIEPLETGKMMVIENKQLKAQFYTSLGDAYNSIKNYQMSDSSYVTSLSLFPENPYVLNNFSYYLSLRNQKLDKALEMMSLCVSISPNISSYEDTYAWIYYKMEDYKKALIWIEKSIKNGGNESSVILEHYGDILFKIGQEELAIKQWIKSKQLGSQSDLIDKKIQDKKLYE